MATELKIADIRTDGGTQMRTQLDLATIAEYADAMGRGDIFPPVVVFYDGMEYWLAEGFHRLEATWNNEREYIVADVREGTREDAVIWACAANAKHGLRRSNADKRNAVETMLKIRTGWSDRQIAEHCAVTHPTVSTARADLLATGKIYQSESRTGADGRTINTTNIGKPAIPTPEPTPAYVPMSTWEDFAEQPPEEEEDTDYPDAEDDLDAPIYTGPAKTFAPPDSSDIPTPQPSDMEQHWANRIAQLEQETPEIQALPVVRFISTLHAVTHITDGHITAWLDTASADQIESASDLFQRIGEFALRMHDQINKRQRTPLRMVKGS